MDSAFLRLLVAACVVVLAGAACGSNSKDDADLSPKSVHASTTTRPAPAPSELAGGLLVAADLPPGWGAPAPDNAPDNDETGDTLCNAKRSPLNGSSHDAEARFSRGSLLPQLVEDLSVLPPEEADAKFRAARDIVQSCVGRSWTDTDEGGAVTTYTLGDVSMPKIGQDSFAARISGSTDLGSLTIDLIFFRSGPVVGLLGGIGGSFALVGSGQIESAEYVQIARAADQKLTALTKG